MRHILLNRANALWAMAASLLLSACSVNPYTQEFRKQAPTPQPAPKIELGNSQNFTLDNGLKVIVVENHKIPKVSFQLFLDNPPVSEKELAGVADITGQLLKAGTSKRNKAEIDKAVDFIGASFSTSASGFFASSLTKHKEKLLEVVAEVLLQPTFPESEFQKIKKQTLSGLAFSKEDADAISSNVSNAIRYGKDHPYGEIMTEETVDSINLVHCRSFYQAYFKPNVAYLTIVGDITVEEAKTLANTYFGTWKKGSTPTAVVGKGKAPKGIEVAFVPKTAAVQSSIAITYPVDLKITDPDYIPTRVLNTLFGGYFRSRINNNIREDKGYSYGVSSSLSADRYVGAFSAGGNVRNEVTDSAIVEFLKEMTKIVNEPVPADELTLVKNALSGSFARNLESPSTIADFALSTARYGLPADFYANYLKKVSEVTAADIQRVAKKYIQPENAYIVVVGDKDKVAPSLARFASTGKVSFYDIYGNPAETIAAPSDVTGKDVVEKYLSAIGGKSKLAGVSSIVQKTTSEIQGAKLETTVYKQELGKFRIEMSMGGAMMNQQVFDGKKAVIIQMGQKQMLDDAASLAEMKKQAVMFDDLDYILKGYTLELTGIEKVGSRQAYVVKVSSPELANATTEYYDVETGLKLKTSSVVETGQGAMASHQEYADYREVNGIKLPYKVTIEGLMPMVLTMETTSVEVNTKLEPALFVVE